MNADNRKPAILAALAAFVNQRPGFDPGNYGDAASYRADQRRAQRQRADAHRLIREIERHDSITADDILSADPGGRVEITEVAALTAPVSPVDRTLVTTPAHVNVHYTTGQYWCTEYRGAVAALCARVLWAWAREHCQPTPANPSSYRAYVKSAGDWLRAYFRREFGASLARRYWA